jgi:hypothetical protein
LSVVIDEQVDQGVGGCDLGFIELVVAIDHIFDLLAFLNDLSQHIDESHIPEHFQNFIYPQQPYKSINHSSSSAQQLTPLLDRIRSTTDVPPAARVVPPSIASAQMAALRVDGGKIVRFATPPRVDTGSIVHSSTRNTTPVAPPAIAAHELAHVIF